MMKNFKNSIVFVVPVIFLLFFASNAPALMISIENTSANVQTAIDLGFNSIGHIYIDCGGVPLSPGSLFEKDYTLLTPDSIWTSYNLFPSNNTSNGWSYKVGDHLDTPLPLVGGTDSVILTFTSNIGGETIPEPASLILLGSGLLGLIVLRKKKK